ncbi:hypothetical protein [Haloarcula laminariae]|uniref:hypothetical protein n=1 Tax=Haloarcula laminariae TaxID=2961577 RepID=UPI00240547A7|nr:hypothetical protein [Halomicroarcula sp. FL173]
MSNDDVGTANTMRERAKAPGIRFRILLELNRLVFAGVLVVAVFVSFAVAVTVLPPGFAAVVRSGDVIDTLFSAMITAIVTGSTLVVSIGQLVISQEDGPLGDQRKRMSDTLDFRGYTDELLDETTPADPSSFLRSIVDLTAERTRTLREGLLDTGDEQLRTEAEEFTESVIRNAMEVSAQLDGATFGTFDVLSAALNFNYSWKLYQVDRISNEHADALDETDKARLQELKTALAMFGPARQHIKTLYFQWELITFSQLTLYLAVPALVVAGVMMATVDATTVTGYTLGVDNLTWVVGAAFAFTLAPFLLFVAYLLRILTVAKRTLAIGPLILRESQR